MLFSALESELAAVRSDPSLLAKPVVVAVPSQSLRLHIAAQLVERAGKAVAGVSLVTLQQLALRIMQQAGESPPPGAVLMPLLVRDLARAEPLLRERLDTLVDGYSAVEASVADLLDAGMEAVHAEGLDERLEDSAAPRGSSQIARAVVRLAGRVANALESEGLGSRSHALRRATELLQEDPSRLAARAVFVHGFSDATGRACDFIAALLRYHNARVLIDEPPDPATGEPLEVFVSHFRQRLESWGRVIRVERAPVARVVPSCLAAPGAEAEVRAVALRVAGLLRDGVSPEGVAVVARDLTSYATPLRVHFNRLGVPFSGLAPIACGGALARRLSALMDLLRGKQRCPADRWLDGVEALGGERVAAQTRPTLEELAPAQRADLRLGLRHLGAARLSQVSELVDRVGRLRRRELERGVALPARRGLDNGLDDRLDNGLENGLENGLDEGRDGDPNTGTEWPPPDQAAPDRRSTGASRRWLAAELLTAACVAARRALKRLPADTRTQPGTFAQHAERIRALALHDLGWRSDAPESQALVGALDSLVNDAPPVETAFDDFAHLLARNLALAGAEPLGGAGGGVQVLGVMEARARTFEHLFVLGMNRDVFPRGIQEDPLLGDSLRRNLAEMLPDIPIKGRGYAEERHLFAQLLASSSRVTLSWQSAADDGKVRAPSTLVERLHWASLHGSDRSDRSDWSVEAVPALYATFRPADGSAVAIPAHEHALEAALDGDREALAGALEVAFQERADALERELPDASRREPPSARELARVRLAVIREFNAAPGASELLGPYFGFVGSPRDPGDPRFARPYVTALEQLARCPWKSFLERTLRIEPVPDPIEALPEVDALLVGSVVHRVLERMVREVLPEQPAALQLAQLGEGDGVQSGVPVAWAGDPEMFAMLREEAARLLAEQGVALAGLVEVLVAQAWPRLECARDLEWPTPDTQIAVAAVELEGSVRLDASSDGAESIYFRADRVDQIQGEFVLTDYKTGRTPSDAVRPATRRKHFVAAVRCGYQLQAVAYALATGRENAVGRYLYLLPDGAGAGASAGAGAGADQVDRLEYRAEAGDDELRSAFERAARALLAARRAGSFAPRLVDSDGLREPALCSDCNVAEACNRGDSGARRRLAQWIASDASGTATQAEIALRAVWKLADLGWQA